MFWAALACPTQNVRKNSELDKISEFPFWVCLANPAYKIYLKVLHTHKTHRFKQRQAYARASTVDVSFSCLFQTSTTTQIILTPPLNNKKCTEPRDQTNPASCHPRSYILWLGQASWHVTCIVVSKRGVRPEYSGTQKLKVTPVSPRMKSTTFEVTCVAQPGLSFVGVKSQNVFVRKSCFVAYRYAVKWKMFCERNRSPCVGSDSVRLRGQQLEYCTGNARRLFLKVGVQKSIVVLTVQQRITKLPVIPNGFVVIPYFGFRTAVESCCTIRGIAALSVFLQSSVSVHFLFFRSSVQLRRQLYNNFF